MKQYIQVPGHPYASYTVEPLPDGSAFLHFACSACGDRSTKRCMAPQQRANHWILRYAHMHGHGLRPSAPR